MTKQRILLNREQACKLLCCSKSYFYVLVNSGKLSSVRIGAIKGLRVYEDECLRYLEECRKISDC